MTPQVNQQLNKTDLNDQQQQQLQVVSNSNMTGGLVKPLANTADIVNNWKEFEALKKALLEDSDYQTYNEGGKPQKFIKKSGWRKLGTAFGITIQVVDKVEKDLGDGRFTITYTVVAIAPNGRSMAGVGSCDTQEDRFAEKAWVETKKGNKKLPTGKFVWKYNDVDSTAYTRATNRAISDLVGGGQVSAEEVTSRQEENSAPPPKLLNNAGIARLLELDVYQLGKSKLAELACAYLTIEQATNIANQLKQLAATQSTAIQGEIVDNTDENQEEAF